MSAEWYYAKDKQRVGPVTEAKLKELARSGELAPADMVWKQGMAKWLPAGAVDGLLPKLPPAQPEPPPLPDASIPVDGGWWEKLKRNRSVFLTVLLAVAMFGSCLGIPIVSWVTSVLPEGTGSFLGFLYALFMVGLLLALLVTGMTALDAREIPAYPGSHFPWAAGERTASSVKLLGLRIGIAVSAVIGLAFLVSIVGAIFCLPFFSLAILIYALGLRRGRLHGRWVPVEGQSDWVEFVSGGIFKYEDGTVGTFILLPNQRFIDLVASGHLVDSWRILTWGVETLEVQDMKGTTCNFKKGKTFEEKQASMFHQERTDDLPGTWMPIDGSGEWVQFTKDGAIVFADGGAGRYLVTGEEPNEVIRVTMADGSAREYRVMSLSKAQLVIVEGSEARTYSRRGENASASNKRSQEPSPTIPAKRIAVSEAASQDEDEDDEEEFEPDPIDTICPYCLMEWRERIKVGATMRCYHCLEDFVVYKLVDYKPSGWFSSYSTCPQCHNKGSQVWSGTNDSRSGLYLCKACRVTWSVYS